MKSAAAGPKAADLELRLRALANPKKAQELSRFFKTGPGEYGEGDVFLGVTVPEQRKVAREMAALSSAALFSCLRSELHEVRLTSLLALVRKFEKAEGPERASIAQNYVKNAKRVNNWDLVDSSAPYILGTHLIHEEREVLYRLAASKSLWERRISIVATHGLIRVGEDGDALRLAALLLGDREDLMHKAVGWTLREVGKRVSRASLEGFLDEYAPKMPRTALRYAIEHFSPRERRRYLELPRQELAPPAR